MEFKIDKYYRDQLFMFMYIILKRNKYNDCSNFNSFKSEDGSKKFIIDIDINEFSDIQDLTIQLSTHENVMITEFDSKQSAYIIKEIKQIN